MTPGTVIAGKYRMERLLGEGAMGFVWSAVNLRTERDVALKLINRSDAELRRRLLREARACGRLRQRNIVEIYDVGETETGEPFLVMQLLLGETLADRLKREGLLQPEAAVRIAIDIARGLGAAHAAGIIHRDLKPANVFLHRDFEESSDSIVKLLDFGVSKILSAPDATATVAGGAVGSPLYMSPEQAKGERYVDHRSDLWSLGVVLFEMLTGTRPFFGETMFTVVADILHGPIPTVLERAPQIDPALGAIVARCLTRELDQRTPSAAEVVAELKRFLGVPEDLPADPDGLPTVPTRIGSPPAADEERTALFQRPAPKSIPDDEAPLSASVDRTVRLADLAPSSRAPSPFSSGIPAPIESPSSSGAQPVFNPPPPGLSTSTAPLIHQGPVSRASANLEAQALVPTRASSKRPALWIAAAALATCALVLGGALLRLTRAPPPPAALHESPVQSVMAEVIPAPPPSPSEEPAAASSAALPAESASVTAPIAAAPVTSAAVPAPSASLRTKPKVPSGKSTQPRAPGTIIRETPF